MKITISFDLETFEFSVSAKFVLMTKCLQDFSQFLLTPRQGQLWQLSVLQLHIKNWPHIHYWVTKTIVEWAFQILLSMIFHELLEIKYYFLRPSSSDSPLLNNTISQYRMIFKSFIFFAWTPVSTFFKDANLVVLLAIGLKDSLTNSSELIHI